MKIGEKINRLTIISEPFRRKNRPHVKCRCECGTVKVIRVDSVKSGHTKSCGCLVAETGSKREYKHGLVGTRIYGIHAHMLNRCDNPNNQSFGDYGGRGIKVCEEWRSVQVFADWAMKNGYDDDLTIERINNDGDYEPSNCEWIPKGEQVLNQRVRTDNTSGYPGVYFLKKLGKYQARGFKDRKVYNLGLYHVKSDAIKARKQFEKEVFGRVLHPETKVI